MLSLKIFFLKLTLAISKVLMAFLFFPILILIRFLRPFILIRLGYFHIQRIGHFAFDLEFYLSQRSLINSSKTLDIFFLSGKPCNSFLYSMCRRHVFCVKGFSFILYLNKLLPFSEAHQYIPAVSKTSSRDIEGILKNSSKKLFFLDSEETKGQSFLKSLGLNENSKFVCLSVRDSEYLKHEFPDKDFSYHDYRNSNIENYSQSIKYLIKKGFFVFRMGKHVSKKISINSPSFLDYASSTKRNDFLDIWLMANCDFAITNGTGIDEITNIFRKPMCYVNYSPISLLNSYNPLALTTPKAILNQRAEPISLNKQINLGFTNLEILQMNLHILKDNSQQEILDSVIEIEKKINNGWERTDQEKKLQERFWNILNSWDKFDQFHFRDSFINSGTISDSYLEKNKEWLLQ